MMNIASIGQVAGADQAQAVFAKNPVTPVAPIQRRQPEPAENVNNQVASLNQALANGSISKDPGTGMMIDLFA